MAEKIRFKVSIKELSFEFEGTREVGQQLQAGLTRSLGNLMDTQRSAMALPEGPANEPLQPTLFEAPVSPPAPPAPPTTNGHANPEKPASEKPARKPRRTGGMSPTKLLRDLKGEGYFSEARSAEVVREKLRVSGHTLDPSNLSSRLREMTQNKELFRAKQGDSYVYKDTPFNDLPRADDAAAEAAD